MNEPIKVESGILNVEIATCSSHEDSRKPSDALIQIQQKIPNVFDNAVYKECYQKNFNSLQVLKSLLLWGNWMIAQR
ncbi:DUF7424 family protein [Pasteurella multocida]|uniref:DUF7424 family protein n=1 Tax=Pasteurella multocida TaxID=747 RepID=UPI003BB0423B